MTGALQHNEVVTMVFVVNQDCGGRLLWSALKESYGGLWVRPVGADDGGTMALNVSRVRSCTVLQLARMW